MKVLILGAGLTGLSAAKKLTDAGHETVIIEKEPTVGGLSRTIRIDGFAFDFGAHRFWADKREIETEVVQLLEGCLLPAPAKGEVVVEKHRLTYPPEILNFASQMPLLLTARCLVDLATSTVYRRLNHQEPKSLKEWAIQHYGRSFYDLFFGPYTEKTWGHPASQLSAPIASERIPAPQIGELGKRRSVSPSGKGNRRNPQSRFYYPKNGIGVIADTIRANLIASQRAELILSAGPTRLQVEGNRIFRCTYSQLGTDSSLECDAVISTIPLEVLTSLLPLPTATLASDVSKLRYRSAIFVLYRLTRPQDGTRGWMYVPDSRFQPCRIYEPQSWSTDCCPPGKGAICAELHCNVEDSIWSESDDSLEQRIRSELQALGVLNPSDVLGWAIYRTHHAYPMEVLPECALAARRIISATQIYDNLVTCGRLGGYRYINMDKAIESGQRAAEYLMNRSQRS